MLQSLDAKLDFFFRNGIEVEQYDNVVFRGKRSNNYSCRIAKAAIPHGLEEEFRNDGKQDVYNHTFKNHALPIHLKRLRRSTTI